MKPDAPVMMRRGSGIRGGLYKIAAGLRGIGTCDPGLLGRLRRPSVAPSAWSRGGNEKGCDHADGTNGGLHLSWIRIPRRALRGLPGSAIVPARTTRLRGTIRTVAIPGNPRVPDLGIVGGRCRGSSALWYSSSGIRGHLAYGHPIVRSGSGGRRPLAGAMGAAVPAQKQAAARASSVVAALFVSPSRPR